jgi:hypothetical protein
MTIDLNADGTTNINKNKNAIQIVDTKDNKYNVEVTYDGIIKENVNEIREELRVPGQDFTILDTTHGGQKFEFCDEKHPPRPPITRDQGKVILGTNFLHTDNYRVPV